MILPTYTDVTGLAGIALAVATVFGAMPGVSRLAGPWRAALTAGVAVLALIPFGPLPLAGFVRGVTGDLSITTLVLLGGAILRRLTGWPLVNDRSRLALVSFVSVAALFLYPMALGVGLFDPYRLGYGSPWLVGALCAVALAAWFNRCELVATCLALATLAWTLHWYESTNLWDYLLDPLVSCYALGSAAIRISRGITRSVRGAAPKVVAAQS